MAAPVGVGQLPVAFGQDRNSLEQRRRRGRGDGHRAMRRVDATGADHGRQRPDRRGRQVGDCGRDADDVGDRIEGADLVEPDALDLRAVELRLDRGDAREDVAGESARVGVEAGALQQAFDFRVVAMLVVVSVVVA